MSWIDISVPIRPGMVVFEGESPVVIERIDSLAGGGICNLSTASLGLHSGTHIDAPVHFIEGGGGIETVDLDACCGPCVVVDAMSCAGHLTARDIDELVPRGAERVLFRTSNGSLWERDVFSREYIALTVEAAKELVQRRVRLVGIDYLSVAPFEEAAPVHLALLEAGIVILEGLDLRAVTPGAYELFCLPLLIPGSDGAPARALLRPAEGTGLR
jgi:arylformamidase